MTGTAHEAQLTARAGELLPDLSQAERLELLGAMDPDDMSASLAWIATAYPQVFDFALVRDRELTERLTTRLADAEDGDDLEPCCTVCYGAVGIFLGCGEDWRHFRGQGMPEAPVELLDASHAPVVGWRPAGAR